VTKLVPVPSIAEVREWLSLSTAAISDAMLGTILSAELDEQERACAPAPIGDPTPLMPVALHAAVFRRCGRHVASIDNPLALVTGSEFGPTRMPSYDAEIERLEGPYRKVVFG